MITPYYDKDGITIYHGDCREILPQLDKVDLVLTDPPYGIGADKAAYDAAQSRIKANGKSKAGRGWKDYGLSDWDAAIPDADLFQRIIELSDNQIIWGGNYFSEHLPPSMGWLVWDKGQREFSLADGELAWSSYQKALRIFTVPRGKALQDGKQHPTQKSLEIMNFSILYADNGAKVQTILDPFMGSGTTLVAAKMLNRKAIGIEIEEKYCKIAVERLRQQVMNFGAIEGLE